MKTIYIVLIIFFSAVIFNAARSSEDFLITHVLPFMGGREPSMYDVAGLVMILIAILFVCRAGGDESKEE